MSAAMSASRAAMMVRNFDFLTGAWRAREHWLTRCGVGSDEWKEREAFLVLRPLLGGMANAEEITYPDNPDFAVATFRCFDIAKAEWIIQSYVYGLDESMPGMFGAQGTLIPALRGSFVDGRGEFIGDSEYEGMPVRVKFIWRDITAISARWERHFSFDGGASWEMNIRWELVRERTIA